MKDVKIVIAPDSFKGSISAYTASCLIESGFKKVFPQAKLTKIPIADGGEGTLEAILSCIKGKKIELEVEGPLREKVKSHYVIVGTTAIIEMAQASGLTLIPASQRNPLKTTSYGTGQLIKDALDKKVKKIVLGIGGSATIDAGAGAITALGVRILDKKGQPIGDGGEALQQCKSVDISNAHPRLNKVPVEILCDVTNPLLGAHGAARVYGPQKGACANQIEILEQGIKNFVTILGADKKQIPNIPGIGAAGGIALPFLTMYQAKLKRGIEAILDICQFDEKVRKSDLVITGEGCLDYQSSFGKTPIGVAQRAKRQNIPVIAICGSLGEGVEQVYTKGIDCYISALSHLFDPGELPQKAPQMLEQCAWQIARILKIGMNCAKK